MKASLRCPKCQSNYVIVVVGHNMNQHQKIPLHKWNYRNAILDRYICADCGYTEEYVQLNERFNKWAEKTWEESGGKYDEYV